MVRAFRLLLTSFLAASVGCASQPAAERLAGRVEPPAVTSSPFRTPEYGYFRLAIRWPQRDRPGFRAALIPTSTNGLIVDISRGGSFIDRKKFTRAADGSPTEITVRLRAGNGYGAELNAYREADPNPIADTPIAHGTATFDIVRSLTTSKIVTLDALFVPTIAEFSTSAARSGDVVTVTGTNLGSIGGAVPVVTLAGTAASVSASVTPVDDTTLRFVVPDSAAIGRVVVRNDGVDSTSNAVLWIGRGISIDAPRGVSGDSSGTSQRMARYGVLLPFSGGIDWAAPPGRTYRDFGPPPNVDWSSSNVRGSYNDFTDEGLDANLMPVATLSVALSNADPTNVNASVGGLTATALTVLPVGVNSITLGFAEISLNAKPATRPIDSAFAASVSVVVPASVSTSLPYYNGIDWRSSDTSRVLVDADGVISTAADAPAGSATVTAKASDDTSFVKTVKVTITRKGGLKVGIK